MKLKALKPHYYETTFITVGSEYTSDKIHGERAVRNGICKELKTAKPKPKRAKKD